MAERKDKSKDREPVIENRKSRFDYEILETLECGIELQGSEVKSLRNGLASLNEGWAKGELSPLSLTLIGVHIGEYSPAGFARQHEPTRGRRLLARKREIIRITNEVKAKSGTLVPLKIYWKGGRAKVLIGLGVGKSKGDKRQSIKSREDKRDMDRAMSKRRG
ncbi:MAG: SsrA-binding protein SmpB [Planctomycetota bacterium]|jgi:SsrA-binding protein|nr:MAG: SsrA-binding protein SmpB [Planctomycetota bacterium]RLS95437.1 MAG: SsrA-binding protein SmpB [Planctomycetota bacterium]